MAWVTEANVEAELSDSITDTSQPTSTELAGFIADIENDVKGVLYSKGVTVASIDSGTTPICHGNVKLWALWGVLSRTFAAMGGVTTMQVQKEQAYWERYKERKAEVLADPAILGSDTPFSTAASDLGVAGLDDDDDEAHDRLFAMDDVY